MSGSERVAEAVREAEEPHRRRGGSDRRALAAFVALVVLISANVVAIRFTNRELPPLWGAATRFGSAALLFWGYVLARRLPLPQGRALAGSVLFGALQFGLGFALGYWSLLEVPAGLASVILALVPLFTQGFAAATRLEPLTVRGVLGGLIALGGIAVIFGRQAVGDIPPLYLVASVATAAVFSSAPVVVKLFPVVHVATNNAVGMLTGVLTLSALALTTGEALDVPRMAATWVAQLYLVLPGSVGVFALLLYVVNRWPASRVAYQAVLSPIVSIALSAWLLGEPVTIGLVWGSMLVLVGVYVGVLARPRRAPDRGA